MILLNGRQTLDGRHLRSHQPTSFHPSLLHLPVRLLRLNDFPLRRQLAVGETLDPALLCSAGNI